MRDEAGVLDQITRRGPNKDVMVNNAHSFCAGLSVDFKHDLREPAYASMNIEKVQDEAKTLTFQSLPDECKAGDFILLKMRDGYYGGR